MPRHPGQAAVTHRVLVVQNAEREGLGLLAAPLAEAGVEARVVQAWAGEPVPRAPEGFDGVVVMGGPPSAYDLASGPWMADAMGLLRASHGRVPVLGVCLGAQLAAHALGGRARPGEAGPEVGFHELTWAPEAAHDPVLAGLPARALQLHHDTFAPPPGAVTLASSRLYAQQAFRLGRATYGVQFHVDFGAAQLAAILEGERKDLEAAGVRVDDVLAEARRREPETQRAARRLAEGWARLLGG
jgi:GMP synthase (glutamine-hydrolysing)